jgi:hypothetical protein
MKSPLSYVGRALLMGLAWSAVWVPAGMVVGRLIVGELEPEWVGGPLYSSVLCGGVFAVLSGTASGRRRVDELSLLQGVAWGEISGFLVGLLPFVLGDQKAGDRPLWILPVVVIGSLTVLSALSAWVSVPIARTVRKNIEAVEAVDPL